MFTEEDKQLIAALGIGNSPEQVQKEQLAMFYQTLQIHVGLALEDQLTDEQLAQFEKIHDAGDDAATEAWVKQVVPSYDEIVAAEKASLVESMNATKARMQKAIEDSK